MNADTTSASSSGISLIVGLGNPGPQYSATRHNAGFWFIEKLCEIYNCRLTAESKFKGHIGKTTIAGKECYLFQSATYMNHSGQALKLVSHFYKIKPKQILVVHDELDLPPGSARLKFDGGHGGHNGLRDINDHLGTRGYYRLRLGIGHPNDRDMVTDYVLHKPSVADKMQIMQALEQAIDVMPSIINGQFEKAMNQLHTVAK